MVGLRRLLLLSTGVALVLAGFPVRLVSRVAVEPQMAEAATARYPALIAIPSLRFQASIQAVWTDPNGSMSVPTAPNLVGWYAGGTIPGEVGSAVLDAHVYLAFKNLKNIKKNDAIYVTLKNGTKLRFVVTSTRTYAYNNVPADVVFNANDASRLNLITCAGTWLPRQGTYTKRLVVYATLAG